MMSKNKFTNCNFCGETICYTNCFAKKRRIGLTNDKIHVIEKDQNSDQLYEICKHCEQKYILLYIYNDFENQRYKIMENIGEMDNDYSLAK